MVIRFIVLCFHYGRYAILVAATDYRCRKGDCARNDIRSIDLDSQDCREVCDDNANCVAFLTNRITTMCFLKTGTCDAPDASTQPGITCDKGKHKHTALGILMYVHTTI